MNTVVLVFLILLVARLVAQLLLDVLNLQSVRAHADRVPESFRGFIDESTYAQSVAYTAAKTRFGMLEQVYDAVVLALVLLSGVLPWAYLELSALLGTGVWGQSVAVFALGVLLAVPALPFDYWSTFKIEDRFGFNKSTVRLWWIDKLKGLVIGFVLMVPLIALLLAFFGWFEQTWWIWGFAAFFVFQLVMVVAYPMFIMPMFNKMEPIEEGSLKERLFKLADRTGFLCQTILVMDGSKRSAHSNAFFAGFGRFRRIVLFDTLIEQLEESELEGVLAHEIGHYKLGHIPKMVALSGVTGLAMFAALGWLAASDWFTGAFGFPAGLESSAPAFLLFVMLSGLVTFWISPLTSLLSRKHEYEADAFARDAMNAPEPLIGALRKLHKENLSNLTPHPVYSGFYYSHPTLPEREGALLRTDSFAKPV